VVGTRLYGLMFRREGRMDHPGGDVVDAEEMG
jgi:hypothetical protein